MTRKFLIAVSFFCFVHFVFPQIQNPLFPYCRAGVWGYADSSGKLVVKPEYQFAGPFFDGMSLVKKNDLFGYINEKGKVSVSIKYSKAENFSNGQAKTFSGADWFLFDKTGKELNSSKKVAEAEENLRKKFGKKYDRFVYMENGLFLTLKDTQLLVLNKEDKAAKKILKDSVLQGCFDMKANAVIPVHLWKIKVITSYYLLVESDKSSYLYSKDGNIVLRDIKSIVVFSANTWRIRTSTAFVYLDAAKNLLLSFKPEYETMGDFRNGQAKFSVTKREHVYYGIVKTNGTEIVPAHYPFIDDAHEGYYVVQDAKGMFGTIDTLGKAGIPFEYSKVYAVAQEKALVCKDGNWKYVDVKGKELFKVSYNYIVTRPPEKYSTIADTLKETGVCFSEGFATFLHNDKYGYIDRNGKEVILAGFDLAEPFHNGVAVVYKYQDQKEGTLTCSVIDKSGKEIFNVRDIHEPLLCWHNPYNSFVHNGKSGWVVFNSQGNKLPLNLSEVYFTSWMNGKFFYVRPEGGDYVIMRNDGKLFQEK